LFLKQIIRGDTKVLKTLKKRQRRGDAIPIELVSIVFESAE